MCPAVSFWPLDHLRLTIGNLTLRPVCEDDLDLLGALLPEDVELDPAAARPFALTGRTERAVVQRQEYWRHLGAWTPTAWRLPMIVFRGGVAVGVQELEGVADFARDRVVDTSSWLIASARGKGIGTAMRTAVLGLAFEGLGARAAVSEAWHDNAASLGVSRSIGYIDTGECPHPRGQSTDRMVGLRLERHDWQARPRPGVQVEGLEACRHLFGAL